MSYAYLFLFLYPLYIVNFKDNFDWSDFSIKTISILLLLLTLLTFQSLIVDGTLSGAIGNFIVDSMMPFIGNAGLWIFVIIGFVISFLILFEDMNFNIDIKKITPSFKKVDTSAKPKRITSRTTEKGKRNKLLHL